MIIKSLSRCYPFVPFVTKLFGNPQSNRKFQYFKCVAASRIIQPIVFAEKGKNEKTGKEEQMTTRMPGFINPEIINEEGYFTQKGKQQLEELKRRSAGKPNITDPKKNV